MGVLKSMRVMLSARSFLHMGPAASLQRLPAVSCTKEMDRDLFLNLRPLALSPIEAFLSSQVKVSSRPVINVTDYRLPAMLKSVTVTVPALYDAVTTEKDLPSPLDIMEKIEPVISGNQQSVEMPSSQVTEKQAARMIVIRRKKMRKHKLKKLRKKMRFVWLKRRQKREYKKEKLFQATQMAKVRKFEAFDAVNYVTDVLQQIKAKPIPRTWKGKRLPEFIIRELMEKEKVKKVKNRQEILEREELKKIKNSYTNKL